MFLFQILVTLFLQGLRSHKTLILYIFRLPPLSVNPFTWLYLNRNFVISLVMRIIRFILSCVSHN